MQTTVVSSWNDFDPLKHAIVGRADFTCIPPSELATEAKIPDDSDMRGMWGPRPLRTIEQANQQLAAQDAHADEGAETQLAEANCDGYQAHARHLV